MEYQIDEFLEKPCYVIDFLPQRVPKDANGDYFDVEYFILNSDKHYGLKDKFVNVILKLMCFYHVSVFWNGWVDHPKPEVIDNAVNEIMENHSGTLDVLFPDENVLMVFEWDCMNLSVYNLPEGMTGIMEKIALSEGLFLWHAD